MSLSVVTHQVYRILAECKDSALQTTIVAAAVPPGLVFLGLMFHPHSNTAERLFFGGFGAVVLLSSAHPYGRLVGAALATVAATLLAKNWLEDSHALTLSDKLIVLLPPVSVAAALAYRGYKLKT